MLEDFRKLERILGRRAALKYGGIGLITVAVAACGGKKNAGQSGDGKLRMGAVALEAFARGTWKLTVTPPANYVYPTITIADGAWHLSGRERAGTYSFAGGTLSVVDPDNDDGDDYTGWTGTGVPGQVTKGSSATLGWATAPATDPARELPVKWDGTTLTIKLMPSDRRRNGGTPATVITAVRA